MPAINKFNAWVENMVEAVNMGSDQFTVALTNTAPVATNSVLSDITEISYTNCSSRNFTTSSSSQSGGVYSLVLTDLTLTASGGSVGPFRYAVIYTGTSLVGWIDYGSSITMTAGQTLGIDFTGNAVVIS
jgi:hypothetical protein